MKHAIPEDLFYTPILSTWRENPQEALRIYMLEVVNGEYIWPLLFAMAIILGSMLCATL